MATLKRLRFDNLVLTYRPGTVDPELVVAQLSKPHGILKKGRGEIKLLQAGGRVLACRRYIHGGLLRALTGKVFLTTKRAADELDITKYLAENRFPVVSPFGYASAGVCCAKSLYFITFYEEHDVDLLEFLKSAHQKERLRVIGALARLFADLRRLGVYHPDLHLQNVLVTKDRRLVFLDFDKAVRKPVTKEDMERMFWRLDRYVEKKGRSKELLVSLQEKTFFLRVFERLSGDRMIEEMRHRLYRQHRRYRLGWLAESLIYGNKKGG